ncbi:hypothetical protein [Pedobacter endophyticus]|uniref:Sensor of ECF-type sigma factor n=1 Tax=Pedobacter endophyticus TaxID=2789740 RepID=A0A7S9PYI9_9SPHI|nr:hypothetical protein [Pedobacter endophyticus]QPH39353.1 hypothetical protein IZT61_20305 [Pedobacter endophyticus]
MKRKLLLSLVLLLAVMVAKAQAPDLNEDEIIRKQWGMALKDLTASVLKLNQLEADHFWPIWDAYREDKKQIVNAKWSYLADYAASYDNMTNEKASEITYGLLRSEKRLSGIKSKYFKKIANNISAIRAAQFIQIETSIDNELRSVLTQNMPLMPDPKQ